MGQAGAASRPLEAEQPEPNEASERRGWPRAAVVLGIALLFVGLASLFAKLLEPLAERSVAGAAPAVAVAPAEASPAPLAAAVPTPPAEASEVKPVEAAAAAQPEPAPFAPAFKGPRVAILLTELGPNEAAVRRAMAMLPREVGFAFSPYPRASYRLASEARAKGHEVWASLPMQPHAFPKVSPGANTLLTRNDPAENLRRLDWALARVDKPIGVTNMMGSAFTEDAAALRPVLAELKARNLVVVDARSSRRSIVEREAKAAGLRAAANDRFLDAEVDPAAIDANLAALEAYARRHGQAIGLARATSTSLDRIAAWAEGLAERGVLLVPTSTLAKRDGQPGQAAALRAGR